MLRLFDANGRDITNKCSEYCNNPTCLGEPWCSAWGICEGTATQPQQKASQMQQESGSGQEEEEYDNLFFELSQQQIDSSSTLLPESGHTPFLESSCTGSSTPPPEPTTNRPLSESHSSSKQPTYTRFAPPKTELEVEAARRASMPKKTREDMQYCMRVWKEWQECRQVTTDIRSMSRMELDAAMCRFVLEIRRKDGKEYPPNTVHHICCGIMRYLRMEGQPDIDFFKEISFSRFRDVLDSEMKRLQGEGVGSKHRQAEPLTQEEEEVLWEKGLLGGHSSRALVDTMLYMCGTYFALRSGQEHRALRFSPSQIELVEKPGERAFLRYTEDVSKNHQGGLKGRKTKKKVAIHHENTEIPNRCFVRLYKLYQSKCPVDRPDHAFYLQPRKTPTKECWYSTTPIGHVTLAATVGRMCKTAGINGYKTNHSLRATAATRLYQAGVDEQLIMEKTGHRSLEGVRSYKRTNTEQQENISDILSFTKRPALQPTSDCSSLEPAPGKSALVTATSNIQNNQQLTFHPDTMDRMFTFTSCSNVNINVNIH